VSDTGKDVRILLVDDDPQLREDAVELLDGRCYAGAEVHVDVEGDFAKALDRLSGNRYDLLILDIRKQDKENPVVSDDLGISLYQEIRERTFIPVIFFTAYADKVEDEQSPVVRVYKKGQPPECLEKMVEELIHSRLLFISRSLIQQVERVERDYLWKFAAQHWDEYATAGDTTSLAYLLARRLAHSLSQDGARQLARACGPATVPSDDETVLPIEYYIIPPMTGDFVCDLYKHEKAEKYFLCLTPSCQFRKDSPDRDGNALPYEDRKLQRILMARCIPLEQHREVRRWLKSPTKEGLKQVQRLLSDNLTDRFVLLPGVFGIPNLVVDFQEILSIRYERFKELTRVASVDTPISSKIVSQFTRYYGRIGSPNLLADGIIKQLNGLASPPAAATASEGLSEKEQRKEKVPSR
jgi:CheY-like chemotaxis protein